MERMLSAIREALREYALSNGQGMGWVAESLGVSEDELRRMASEEGSAAEWAKIASLCGCDLGLLLADPAALEAEIQARLSTLRQAPSVCAMIEAQGVVFKAVSEEELDQAYFAVQSMFLPRPRPGEPAVMAAVWTERGVAKASGEKALSLAADCLGK